MDSSTTRLENASLARLLVGNMNIQYLVVKNTDFISAADDGAVQRRVAMSWWHLPCHDDIATRCTTTTTGQDMRWDHEKNGVWRSGGISMAWHDSIVIEMLFIPSGPALLIFTNWSKYSRFYYSFYFWTSWYACCWFEVFNKVLIFAHWTFLGFDPPDCSSDQTLNYFSHLYAVAYTINYDVLFTYIWNYIIIIHDV